MCPRIHRPPEYPALMNATLEERILAYLTAAKRPVSLIELRDTTEGPNDGAAFMAIQDLQGRGWVRREGFRYTLTGEVPMPAGVLEATRTKFGHVLGKPELLLNE